MDKYEVTVIVKMFVEANDENHAESIAHSKINIKCDGEAEIVWDAEYFGDTDSPIYR